MGVIRSVEGIYRLKIISASPAEMLAAVNTAGIQIENVEFIDDLCIINKALFFINKDTILQN